MRLKGFDEMPSSSAFRSASFSLPSCCRYPANKTTEDFGWVWSVSLCGSLLVAGVPPDSPVAYSEEGRAGCMEAVEAFLASADKFSFFWSKELFRSSWESTKIEKVSLFTSRLQSTYSLASSTKYPQPGRVSDRCGRFGNDKAWWSREGPIKNKGILDLKTRRKVNEQALQVSIIGSIFKPELPNVVNIGWKFFWKSQAQLENGYLLLFLPDFLIL